MELNGAAPAITSSSSVISQICVVIAWILSLCMLKSLVCLFTSRQRSSAPRSHCSTSSVPNVIRVKKSRLPVFYSPSVQDWIVKLRVARR